jgi:hypothetical protein
MKVEGGELGIVAIGALSAWLRHTGKLMQVNWKKSYCSDSIVASLYDHYVPSSNLVMR